MSRPIHLFKPVTTALLGCAALVLTAGAAGAGPLVQVTGPSPFSGCTADNVAGQPGTNYPEAEVEPWIEVNPANSSNLIAGWQQDRWSNGGSRSLMSGYSTNGGASWTPVVVPGLTKCSDGNYDRASDPWVAITKDGVALFMSLVFMNDEPSGAGGDNAMMMSRSTDGGASWGAPQFLINDTNGQVFNDKNAVTADPNDGRYAYAVWDRLVDNLLPVDGKANGHKANGGDGAANARARHKEAVNRGGTNENFRSYIGPAYFARTIDGGLTWEAAKELYNPGTNAQTISSQVAVLNNGDVLDFFTVILHNGQTSISYVKSSDHGATFGPVQLAVKTSVTTNGTVTPDAKESVRDGNILFDLAIDRNDGAGKGNLYLVWQDGQAQNIDRVAFSMSTNSGVSWSAPVLINKTPNSTNKLRNQAFIPSVEVGAGHQVFVTHYDFRNDTNNGKESVDMWAISCNIFLGANCRTAGGWGNEVRLTDTSFNILDAPVARGHFLGDYQGLVNAGGTVKALFGKAVGTNVNDMFMANIP